MTATGRSTVQPGRDAGGVVRRHPAVRAPAPRPRAPRLPGPVAGSLGAGLAGPRQRDVRLVPAGRTRSQVAGQLRPAQCPPAQSPPGREVPARGSHRQCRSYPDRSGQQGLDDRVPARRPRGVHRPDGAGQDPGPGPVDDRRPLPRLRPPGGESGNNMARVVNVPQRARRRAGRDHHPLLLVPVQTTRMAFHAIKAGEGDVHLLGRRDGLAVHEGHTSDHWPDTKNPVFADAEARTATTAEGGVDWHDPARTGRSPTSHRHGPDRGERRREAARPPPPGSTSSASGRRTWPRRRSPTASGSARSPGDHAQRHRRVRRRRSRAGVTYDGIKGPQAGVPARRGRHRRQLLRRSTTAPPR